MKATTTFKTIIVSILLLNSCYYDNEAELYAGGEGCADTTSSYNSRLKGIIDNLCIGCHSPQGGYSPDLTDFTLVSEKREAIICRVVNSPSCGPVMPQSGVIDPCDKQAFELWQQNGFRE